MRNFFIILAAGDNKRLKSTIPKPYIKINDKKIIQYSIDTANTVENINKIVIVYNNKHKKFLKSKNFDKYLKVVGGKSRAESVFKALKKIKKYNCKNVLIHDAARPNVSANLIKKILITLKKNKSAIPILKLKDSIKIKKKDKLENFNRDLLYSTQTPQGFDYDLIFKLNSTSYNQNITDDASLLINGNKQIKIINGDEDNNKITTANDIKIFKKKKQKKIMYGIGFDVHRLVPKKKLFLGGIKIPFKLGTLGHSDGDPVLHAITDALLGACQLGDIGEKFSDTNNKFRNIRSTIILSEIVNEIKSKKYLINNIDINIITQKPKIKKYKNKMIKKISSLCGIELSQINIKGKTTEKLGIIGKEKAIACEAIASVISND